MAVAASQLPRGVRVLVRRGNGYNAALRQLGNRLVGILDGCLKRTPPTTNPLPGPSTPNKQELDI